MEFGLPFRSHLAGRIAVGALSVAAAGVALLPPPPPAVVAGPAPAPTPLVQLAPTPVPVPAFRPLRIEIPALRVSAPVVPVGIDATGAMGTPRTAHEVAWWDGMAVGAGNALLAGHKDWNRRPGSFFRLSELRPGDAVVVLGEGGRLEFRVAWVRQVPGDAEAGE